MSDKKKNQDLRPSENAGDPTKSKVAEKTKTVYVHGKKFIIPMSKDLDEFLKEKFPKQGK